MISLPLACHTAAGYAGPSMPPVFLKTSNLSLLSLPTWCPAGGSHFRIRTFLFTKPQRISSSSFLSFVRVFFCPPGFCCFGCCFTFNFFIEITLEWSASQPVPTLSHKCLLALSRGCNSLDISQMHLLFSLVTTLWFQATAVIVLKH